MEFWYTNAFCILAWAIACAWAAITAIFVMACRTQKPLRPTTNGLPLSCLPKLSVIIAARNESGCIENCIRSLIRQDYPNLEVVAVNDRSTDDTGAILDRLATEFPDQVRAVHVATLPTGWFGKTHALDKGMLVATGDFVCFSDADCEFLAPSAMRTTVEEMLRKNVDFISIAAKYTMSSVRECVLVPCCSEAIMAWLRPERISDPRWDDAFANGAFIMVRRIPFESIGGWSSVRAKISEDLEVARLAKRSGLKLAVAQGEGFYQTGSYGTVRESWNGWSRIFNGVLTRNQLAITLIRMLILFVLPLSAMIYGVASLIQTGSADWFMHGTGLAFAIAFGLRCTLDVIMFRVVGAPLASIPLAPLGRLFVMASLVKALLSHIGLVQTHWRGMTYVSGRLIAAEQLMTAQKVKA